jgi:hypothetical protein
MNKLAYILSTSWHETAATMMPIAEYGKGEGHDYGEPCPQYGNQVAYGRGYVQLTWDYNYEKADDKCSLNGALLGDFDLALDPVVASQIIFRGMLEGWFTGKKLGDYVNEGETDYVNARRVVNGTDKAEMLAGYAEDFEQALRDADYGVVWPGDQPEPVDPDEITTPPETDEHPPQIEPEPDMPDVWYEYQVTPYDEASFNTYGSAGWRLAHIKGQQIIWERIKDE